MDAIRNGSAGHQNVMQVTFPEAPKVVRAWLVAGGLCLLCAILTAVSLYTAAQAQAEARTNRLQLEKAKEAMARKYDRMEDYQRTMFMLVPDLRKMVEAEQAKQHQEKR